MTLYNVSAEAQNDLFEFGFTLRRIALTLPIVSTVSFTRCLLL